jgi:hypothetical protein
MKHKELKDLSYWDLTDNQLLSLSGWISNYRYIYKNHPERPSNHIYLDDKLDEISARLSRYLRTSVMKFGFVSYYYNHDRKIYDDNIQDFIEEMTLIMNLKQEQNMKKDTQSY